jgi:hypothetical protein
VLYHQFKIGIASNVFIKHDSQNNNSKAVPLGSAKYYTLFLNRIKVTYGNVNKELYKEFGKVKLYFFKRAIINLIKFNFKAAKVNLKKWQLLKQLDVKTSVLTNRQKGMNYL